MKSILALILAGIFSLAAPLRAQEKGAPPIVARGFQAYQKDGVLAAIDAWLVGSARETDDDLQDLAAARMNRMQDWCGRMMGYELIRTVGLSPSTQRVYAAVKFEKGVAWMSFDCYKPGKDWIIARFDFNCNANLVLAPNILGGQ